MKNKLPVPVCLALLACRQIFDDPKKKEKILVGLPRYCWSRNYPAAGTLSFVVRCTSGHEKYPLEVQIVRKGGPVELGAMLGYRGDV